MNEKQMNIAKDATAKGIVSLYNRGFVPKKTGKVNKKSNFAKTGKSKTLYTLTTDDPKETNMPSSHTLESSQ